MQAMNFARAAAWWAEQTNTPRPHSSTIRRWVVKGVGGTRLQAQRRGGRWFVTDDAMQEFRRIINSDAGLATLKAADSLRAAEITKAHAKLDAKLQRGRRPSVEA